MERIIGIDFGLSKVGVAISDPSGIISLPLKVIRYNDKKELINSLTSISEEKNVKKFVIGYPIGMNYKKNEMTETIDFFKKDMEEMGYDYYDNQDSIVTHCKAINSHPGFQLIAGVDLDNNNINLLSGWYKIGK